MSHIQSHSYPKCLSFDFNKLHKLVQISFPELPSYLITEQIYYFSGILQHSHLHFSAHISTAHPQSVLYLFLCLCVFCFDLSIP